MKKLFVVSKTHLDLGFTDYAETIRQKYINEFIPGAVALAEKVNTPEKKSFIWTTGSWILKEALKYGTKEQSESLKKAIERGDIVPHAMPFTTHTELLDEDTLDFGLKIVEPLDEMRGRKTVAAKVTDVPGHTIGMVKVLASHGIKLLHIGVNGASSLVEVPPCFLWKDGDAEVVVVYSGDYGGAFKADFMDEILYFDHTLDNHGAPSPEKVLAKLKKIEAEHPGYEVTAGTMDEFADIIWEKRDMLPVITDELGDTWIHGSAADPYKSASLRELMSLKGKWLADGTMKKDSEEYREFSDKLLCIAEHTCGMDMKIAFADYDHYLKKDFQKARARDKVKVSHPFREFPQNILSIINGRTGSYKRAEGSWAEQRLYIDAAVNALSDEHKEEALSSLAALRPEKPLSFSENGNPYEEITAGGWSFRLNKNGGIGYLTKDGKAVIKENDRPALEYRSYTHENYEYWLNNYTRNFRETQGWCVGDFARPLLKYEKGKYPAGRFAFKAESAAVIGDGKIAVNLTCDKKLCEKLGAPRLVQVIYTLTENGLKFELSWFGKDANRLTEALFLRLFPAEGELTLAKLGSEVSPLKVVSKGGRNLHAVQNVTLKNENGKFVFKNYHAPLFAQGQGKILEFDNSFEDTAKDGFSFLLHNNVWGTNFPLWYEENAYFKFEVTEA